MVTGDFLYLALGAALLVCLPFLYREKSEKLIEHISRQPRRKYQISLVLMASAAILSLYLIILFWNKNLDEINGCSVPGCATSHNWSIVFLFSCALLFFIFFVIRGIRYLRYTKSR